MTQETAAKKDTQKLQRAIVDGLEDVKAQDIQVFNTEHLSPLFERVIVASGTSNRQTKALAASVRDAVREAGFPKPRIEGEENGEWIIVDCGAAVAHIMQPAIRQYYHLEEIWGDKPVRLRLGSPKPAFATPKGCRPAKKAPAGDQPAPQQRREDREREAARPRRRRRRRAARRRRPPARRGRQEGPGPARFEQGSGQEGAARNRGRSSSRCQGGARQEGGRQQEGRRQEGHAPQGLSMRCWWWRSASACPTGRRPPGTTTPSAFPPELRLELKAVKTEPRGSRTVDHLAGRRARAHRGGHPAGARIVALDERGTALTTVALAPSSRPGNWRTTTSRW
jgi:ribosome-associated protein